MPRRRSDSGEVRALASAVSPQAQEFRNGRAGASASDSGGLVCGPLDGPEVDAAFPTRVEDVEGVFDAPDADVVGEVVARPGGDDAERRLARSVHLVDAADHFVERSVAAAGRDSLGPFAGRFACEGERVASPPRLANVVPTSLG